MVRFIKGSPPKLYVVIWQDSADAAAFIRKRDRAAYIRRMKMAAPDREGVKAEYVLESADPRPEERE